MFKWLIRVFCYANKNVLKVFYTVKKNVFKKDYPPVKPIYNRWIKKRIRSRKTFSRGGASKLQKNKNMNHEIL